MTNEFQSGASAAQDGDVLVTEGEMRDSSHGAANVTRVKVLVVDDEPLVCWSVAETLEDAGYDVVDACDGASAIQAFSAHPERPDIVLLDLYLPDSTDLRVLSALHGLSPLTPIVVVTAHGSPPLREEAHRLGAVAVVDKPVDMSALAPLVARALVARA